MNIEHLTEEEQGWYNWALEGLKLRAFGIRVGGLIKATLEKVATLRADNAQLKKEIDSLAKIIFDNKDCSKNELRVLVEKLETDNAALLAENGKLDETVVALTKLLMKAENKLED